MFYLLQLGRDRDVRLLPIADTTAVQLERALLANEHERSQPGLCQAVARDPFLAVWIDHECRQRNDSQVDNVADAATWLSLELAAKLSSSLSVGFTRGFVPQRVHSLDCLRYAQLGAEIVARATGAIGNGCVLTESVFWSSVIKHRRQLLDCCPTGNSGRRRWLPAFPTVPPPDRSLPTPDAAAGEAPAAMAVPATYLEYYLQEAPDIQWRLPALISRMAELSHACHTFHQCLEQEKLASLKELAYGASHEINNPLANITARAQTLLRDEAAPDRRRKLQAIFDQAMRAHEMIADLMLFAHPPLLVRNDCSLAELVRHVTAELQEEAASRDIDLRAVAENSRQIVSVDKTQLLVAMRALVVNALEAVGHKGKVDVILPVADAASEFAQIIVRDNGRGVRDELRRHIFDPFFSGREAGRGLGFGLSKCWRIVTEHGGRVDVRSAAQIGAEFVISLPCEVTQPVAA